MLVLERTSMSKTDSGTKESTDTDRLDELPDWVPDGADRKDAIAAMAWDRAHQARTALTGESYDVDEATRHLRAALTILEEDR